HVSPRGNVTLAVLMSFIDVFTIIANLTVIASMIWSHVRRRRNLHRELNSNNHITKLLIGSTAVANVFIGVFIMPLGIHEMINRGKWTLGKHMCRARLTVLMILCTVSAYHVMCLALDRYMSVCKPLKYRLLTTKIGRSMAAACWGIPVICLTVPSTAGWHLMGFEETAECNDLKKICDIIYNSASFVTLIVTALYLPFIISFILYTLVLVEVRNFNKRKTKYHRHERQESIAICTVGSIVVCYTVCWLPMWICSMMAVLLSSEIPFWVFVLIVWFATSHAALNPVLFCLNRSIRRAVKLFLCRKYE
ncbi:unnamed protein product, partial [Lymnaea stagnalis]